MKKSHGLPKSKLKSKLKPKSKFERNEQVVGAIDCVYGYVECI